MYKSNDKKVNSKSEKDSINEEIVNSLIENLKDNVNLGTDNPVKSNSDVHLVENATMGKDEHETENTTEHENSNIPENNDENDFDEILKDRDVNLSDDEKKELLEESQIDKNNGNKEYQNGNYQLSIALYTKALRTCPLEYINERSIMYCNRAASEIKLDLKKEAINDCTKAIELNPNYLKAYLRRSKLYEEDDKLDEALEDYNKIVQLDRNNRDAISACMRLPEQIKERNEKLKTEMLGKLKDLGNTLLRPFGLSTNNFQMTQDPNTGGYSVNFVQNRP